MTLPVLRSKIPESPRRTTAVSKIETKASKAGKLISIGMLGQPVWTPRQYDRLAEESYAKNAVAYRAINEIAKCAGSVPFNLFKGTGESRREILDSTLLDLMERPNPMQGRSSFIQSIIGFLLIAGNSYIERVGGSITRLPRELWPKRPDRMQVKAGRTGIPSAYIFTNGAQSVEWPASQINGQSKILQIKTFHPLNDWYGMSPIEAAAFSVDQHNEAGAWNMALLQNSARPSGALIVDPKSGTGLDDDQFNRLKEQIHEQTGSKYAGDPLLLEGGLDWKEMSLSPVDMDWLQGKHTSARDIAMVLGMPAQMLGIPGDNTHRNMEEARLWLWEQTIIPLLDFLLQELNWWLTPLFGDDLELVFDLDEVPALISRRHTLWDKVQVSDFLTINEKREAVGYEPVPEGDVIRTPSKNVDLGAEPEEDPKLPPKANGKDKSKGALKEEGQQ